MNTNDLYQAALETGTARITLNNGDVLICAVDKVAGRSITKKHYRTTFLKLAAGEQYSKQISRAKAVEMLKD